MALSISQQQSNIIGKIQAFVLAKMIKNLSPKTEIFLLGGMTPELFRKIKKLDYNIYDY
jgi:hypothetical protein